MTKDIIVHVFKLVLQLLPIPVVTFKRTYARNRRNSKRQAIGENFSIISFFVAVDSLFFAITQKLGMLTICLAIGGIMGALFVYVYYGVFISYANLSRPEWKRIDDSMFKWSCSIYSLCILQSIGYLLSSYLCPEFMGVL